MKNRFTLVTISLFLFATGMFFRKTEKKPNILMIVLDDAGLDMSAYGRKWVNTPAFDRIANEGILYEKAYTPNAKCAPSRATILTGRNPWQLDAAMNHGIFFPTKFKTFPETLEDNGYTIGYTGKGYAPGKAFYADGTKRELLGPNYSKLSQIPPTSQISKNDYAANFEDFIGNNDSDKPWCFWIGFTEPHRAYEYGSSIKAGGKNISDIERVPKYWPDNDTIRTDMLDYAFEIEYVDKHVTRVLDYLEKIGELENTLIIYTSDHGMPFPRVKGNQYESANHIPFAMRWGTQIKQKGQKNKQYAKFIDIAPTILEAAGIDEKNSEMQPITGKSLLSIPNSDAYRNYMLVGQERHDYGRPNDVGYPIRGLHKDGFLLLKNYETSRWPVCNPETGYLNCDGGATKTFILNQRRLAVTKEYWKMNFGKRETYELYDLSKDADCVNNLANQKAFEKRRIHMETEMEEMLLEEGDLRMTGYGYLYEQYPFSEVNGFYERFMKGEKIPTGWVNDSDYEKTTLENE
jgi:N-sulfoglucosamine sulfohydrolase